ncbi:MAG: bifunctional adenosylcobinamide kinase/adenosylcobinamide-phosphate guanylyltransferase [Pseudomonadota bacterium]
MITFVLGGARSGKSVFAENLVKANAGSLAYIATGQAWDREMKTRIELHQERRADRWRTIEAPTDLKAGLEAADGLPVLLDCLTLWVTNMMMRGERDPDFSMDAAFADLEAALAATRSHVVIVSNEVGQGIVPDNKMARQFRDHAGTLHQRIAAMADEVYFVTAGLPQKLK